MVICYSSNRKLLRCLMVTHNNPEGKLTTSPNSTFEPYLMASSFSLSLAQGKSKSLLLSLCPLPLQSFYTWNVSQVCSLYL